MDNHKFTEFHEYKPDARDLCSLCGGNVGSDALIACKDNINVCAECVDLLVTIKKEREAARNEITIAAILEIESNLPDSYQPREFAEAILQAATNNKIPRLQVLY